MKLSVMFVVFLMLAMSMTDADNSPRAVNGEKANGQTSDAAARAMALLKERQCPPSCKPNCESCK